MGVDEAGGGRVPVEVDDAGAGETACKFQNFGIAADFHNDAAPDGDGMGDRVSGIYGENASVKQQKVGGGALRGKQWSSQ